MSAKENKIQYLKDYRPSWYGVRAVEMWVDFRSETTAIQTKLAIDLAVGTAPGEPLELDGEELDLISVAIDGTPLEHGEYVHDARGLTLKNPPGKSFELLTEVRVKPEKNTKLMGLYRSKGIWTTQCEAEGFRRITFMLDRPDIMATYRVHLEADKAEAPVLLSNGNLLESGMVGDDRHYAIWDDPHPKPTYLFAVVAGDLDHICDEFTTVSGRHVDLAVYCEPGKGDKCTYAMDALKRSMVWDEQRFGREYDLEVFNIVAVSDFNSGAMENKGLNIFNDKYILADPDSATDLDYYNIERIVAHEYFHNWTGNRVTCRDWFQLCLKEGLTVYRDQEFTSDTRSRAVKRIGDARSLKVGQFAEDAGPLAHPPRPDNYAEIDNFYTATVYNKGAEIVRMLATLLGTDGFRKGTDLYFERHDGQATTIESWIRVFEESSGRDLSQFIKWYTQAGTPHVRAKGHWDQHAKTYILTLSQETKPTPGQDTKEPMFIPLKFGLVGPNGQDLDWHSVSGNKVVGDVIELKTQKTELVFHGVSSQPVLSLLREFSAPISLSLDQSDADQFFLARHDADPFNRWQASQGIATEMMANAARGDGHFSSVQVEGLAAALRDTLGEKSLDNAFKALVMTLPAQPLVSQAIGNNIDPAKVFEARRALANKISHILMPKLLDTYHSLKPTGEFTQDMTDVQKRSLRNQCLGLLVAGETEEMDALAAEQYYEATNMNDRMGALACISARWAPDAETHLEHFRAQFASNELIYDKWLSLMALAPDKDCLSRVEQIYESRDFNKKNPNRLHALIGSFTMGNVARFTDPDGSGFEFAARVAKEIDPINPHISSSIMESFRMWRSWEPNRQSKAEKIMAKLATRKENSRDLTDILARTLAP